nr:hypothetical protein CFP56_02975 [Quercus suber]
MTPVTKRGSVDELKSSPLMGAASQWDRLQITISLGLSIERARHCYRSLVVQRWSSGERRRNHPDAWKRKEGVGRAFCNNTNRGKTNDQIIGVSSQPDLRFLLRTFRPSSGRSLVALTGDLCAWGPCIVLLTIRNEMRERDPRDVSCCCTTFLRRLLPPHDCSSLDPCAPPLLSMSAVDVSPSMTRSQIPDLEFTNRRIDHKAADKISRSSQYILMGIGSESCWSCGGTGAFRLAMMKFHRFLMIRVVGRCTR